jgi:hypothetical protein
LEVLTDDANDDDLAALETRIAADGTVMVALRDLADAHGTTPRTLNRVARERDIERVKFELDRRTWVPLLAMREALSEPQRRPGRVPRPNGQLRDGNGRFTPGPDTSL